MKIWQQRALQELSDLKVTPDFPMAELTTFKIGGPIDLLIEVESSPQLQKALQFCSIEGLPWMIVGLGSNLLVRDKGIRGVGLKMGGEFVKWSVDGTKVTAGSGVPLADLAKGTACQGLTGLEFACGIPGTVGGAIYMNAGAYDGDISGVVSRVDAFNLERGEQSFHSDELELGYRHSRFQGEPWVLLRAIFELKSIDIQTATAKVDSLTCSRESKQPLDMPSAGSVFKRPEGYYVGPLIEEAGLKGYQIGGAQVSKKHAGFIVNAGGATANDVLQLIQHIQSVIREKFGVNLVPEIKVIGEE